MRAFATKKAALDEPPQNLLSGAVLRQKIAGSGQIGTDGALDTRITRTIIPDLAPLISVASLWERYYRLPLYWLTLRFSPTANSNGVPRLRWRTVSAWHPFSS